jgi:hypothetical protein
MEEKFHWLVDPVLGKNRANELVELVWSFDEQAGVDRLVRGTLAKGLGESGPAMPAQPSPQTARSPASR